MRGTVDDDGVLFAPILVIGEAPGKEEQWQGLPFVGPSGSTLRRWWQEANLSRVKCYITNVLKHLPDSLNGNIDLAFKSGTVTREDVEQGYARIYQLIESMPNLKCIVPIGNWAAYGVTEHGGRTAYDMSRPGITSIRGSVYWYKDKIPVVPTIHPAATMRQPTWETRCIKDWKRIAAIVNGADPRPPERNYIIYPSRQDLENWLEKLNPLRDVVAVDIETWGGEIKCVGLAASNTEAIVIPTAGVPSEDYVWSEFLEPLLEIPDINIVMQNGLFDAWWLWRERGIQVKGYEWDTLAMHHCLDPLDNHSLDYMASIDTWQPYWKDEAKQADEIVRYAKQGMDKLYIYNAIDCCVTHELFEVYFDRLCERKMMRFYLQHYADMHEPLLSMSQQGIRVDLDKIYQLQAQFLQTAQKKRDEACNLAGRPLFNFKTTKCERDMTELWLKHGSDAKDVICAELVERGHQLETVERKWQQLETKMISDKELGALLYEEWEAPKGRRTDTGKPKLDDISLKGLRNEAEKRKRGLPRKDHIVSMVDLVLAHRRSHKLSTFLDPSRVDPDGYVRCEYRFATRTGRLASRANPSGTGANLQNYDRTLKPIFVPSPGNILLEVDLSQAEGRVVKALTGSDDLIRLARRKPTDGDEHSENAAAIFGAIFGRDVVPEEVTYEQRQIGKRVVHATNYSMGKNRLADILLKEGFIVTPYEAGKMIDAYKERSPGILTYQQNVRQVINQKRELFTSWGRRVCLDNQRLDDELFKFGYAYIPQSEIGDLTNQYGVKALYKWLVQQHKKSVLRMQVHDSVVVDCVPAEVYAIMSCLAASLSQPRRYGHCLGLDIELSIPCEFAIGTTWKMQREWKYLPSEVEVQEAIKELMYAA